MRPSTALLLFFSTFGCTGQLYEPIDAQPDEESTEPGSTPLSSSHDCTHLVGACNYCPNVAVELSANVKMALGVAGFDEGNLRDQCEALSSLPFPDGYGCEHGLGPWIQMAGHWGLVTTFHRGSMTKADIARLLIGAVHRARGIDDDGWYAPSDEVTPRVTEDYVRFVSDRYYAENGRRFWTDSAEIIRADTRDYVEFMGIKDWADGIRDGVHPDGTEAYKFGWQEYIAKGGVAKMLLRGLRWTHAQVENIARSRLNEAGSRYFLDSETARGPSWVPYIETLRALDKAHGITGECPTTDPAPEAHQPSWNAPVLGPQLAMLPVGASSSQEYRISRVYRFEECGDGGYANVRATAIWSAHRDGNTVIATLEKVEVRDARIYGGGSSSNDSFQPAVLALSSEDPNRNYTVDAYQADEVGEYGFDWDLRGEGWNTNLAANDEPYIQINMFKDYADIYGTCLGQMAMVFVAPSFE